MNHFLQSEQTLAKLFDSSLLHAIPTDSEIEKCCDEARRYQFATMVVNTANIARCSELLKGSGVPVGAAISFPLGQTSVRTKLAEISNAFEDGAGEIDYIINIAMLKQGRLDYIEDEMKQITELCHKNGAKVKAITENSYLTKEEIADACRIANQVGPDFLKTATGTQGPATIPDVRIMRAVADPAIKIKVSGGIRALDDVLTFIDLGVDRMGTLFAANILVEYMARKSEFC